VQDYANMGGRVFLSHWHNYWMRNAPAPWPSIATFLAYPKDNEPGSVDALVNTAFERGPAFKTWLGNVMALNPDGTLPITEAKNTCTGVDTNKAENWVYLGPDKDKNIQNLQFTTPNDKDPTDRCGKVVFSDMHVSGQGHSDPGTPGYPDQCDTGDLSPQEKALAFMFFDIASCVGPVLH